jgi:choline dehydrogenase-like flavoprotein
MPHESGRSRTPEDRATTGRRFRESDEVDFVVVGSGAAGGVLARELAASGFQVVVLEQGPSRRSTDFTHDELGHWCLGDLQGSAADFPQTFRRSGDEDAEIQDSPPPLIYARGVGGSSVHFTANYWRFRPVDFRERTRWAPIPGTGFADWPITYDELEPYDTKVDQEIGVSGAPGPFDPPRSRPFPMPPLPVESNNISLDPEVEDRWGRPAIRVTYRDHPDDLAAMQFFLDRSLEILDAAGAGRIWSEPVQEQSTGAHLLGTCRMGDDPAESVVDRDHRAHDVPNLFICDGSSLVTSGRGQPTMTIQALAFRASDRIAELARQGSI